MDDFLTEADCAPNLNSSTIAGKLTKVEPLAGKTPGLTFVVGYTKTWPNGQRQVIPIQCYVSRSERMQKLKWMKPGEVVLVQGEVTNRSAIYGHRVEWLSKPEGSPGEDDAYVAGMQRGKQ